MKIGVVSSGEEIFTLSSCERFVYLAFRPSSKDSFGLIGIFSKVEAKLKLE